MPVYDAFISYSHADSGTIAPAIQKGLQTIGRPWYRLGRTLNIFRDETNLAASPHLWGSIDEALREADYFILFASPVAASSKWVDQEVSVWLERFYQEDTGLANMFIVLTEGNIEWDEKNNDFDWVLTNALPTVLKKKFLENPAWIDLRPYVKLSETGRQIDIKAAGFTTAMTKIIGGIRGIDPWQVESDEIRSRRNTRAIRSAVILLLLALSVAMIIFWYRANRQRAEAVAQRKIADQQKAEAFKQRNRAQTNLDQFKIEELERNIREGSVYLEAEEYTFALQAFEKAEKTIDDQHYGTLAAIKQRSVVVKQALLQCSQKLTKH